MLIHWKILEVLNEVHMFSTSVNHTSWDKTEDYGIKIIMAKLRGSLPSIMVVYRTPLVDTSIHENIYCETLWVWIRYTCHLRKTAQLYCNIFSILKYLWVISNWFKISLHLMISFYPSANFSLPTSADHIWKRFAIISSLTSVTDVSVGIIANYGRLTRLFWQCRAGENSEVFECYAKTK